MSQQQSIPQGDFVADTEIPSTYTKISEAGSGLFGEVYFCLPAVDLAITHPENSPKNQIAENLLSKIFVVKIDTPLIRNWSYPLYHEVAVLKAIQKQTHDGSSNQHFFRLLEWDMMGRNTRWIVTSSSLLCCTLDEMRVCFDSMPEDFLWLSYVQLHDALTFMHHTCNPPIAHNDLHKNNIMVTFSNLGALGVPELKLIDFGSSNFVESNKIWANPVTDPFEKDVSAFFLVLDNIVHNSSSLAWDEVTCKYLAKTHCPKDRSLNFYKFHSALIKGLDGFDEDGAIVQRKLWERFGAYAIQQVAAMSESSTKQIQDNVLFVAKPKYEANEKKLEEILADLRVG